jgi:protein JSN1
LASLTVLRIVNQKIEPEASRQIVEALFASPGDHVLTDVLGDQVNGVAVVHKILTSPFIDPLDKMQYIEATKRVLIELKVIATQAYRRLIEEVGLPIPNYQPTYTNSIPPTGKGKNAQNSFVPGLPQGYPSNDQGLASMMAALQMGGQNPQAGPPQLHIDPGYEVSSGRTQQQNPQNVYNSANEHYNSYGMRAPAEMNPRGSIRRTGSLPAPGTAPQNGQYNTQSPSLTQAGSMLQYGAMPTQNIPAHLYQTTPQYMYYAQNSPNMGNMGPYA